MGIQASLQFNRRRENSSHKGHAGCAKTTRSASLEILYLTPAKLQTVRQAAARSERVGRTRKRIFRVSPIVLPKFEKASRSKAAPCSGSERRRVDATSEMSIAWTAWSSLIPARAGMKRAASHSAKFAKRKLLSSYHKTLIVAVIGAQINQPPPGSCVGAQEGTTGVRYEARGGVGLTESTLLIYYGHTRTAGRGAGNHRFGQIFWASTLCGKGACGD